MTIKEDDTTTEHSDEQRKFVREFRNYLSTFEHVVTDLGHADIGVGIANRQKARWQVISAALQNSNLTHVDYFSNLFDQLRETTSRLPAPNIHSNENKTVVTHVAPLLLIELNSELRKQLVRFPLEAYLVAISQLRGFFARNSNLSQQYGSVLLSQGAAEVVVLSDRRFERMSEAASIVETFRALLDEQKSRDDEQARQYQLRLEEARSALAAEVSEYLKIDTSLDLWKKKANWNLAGSSIFGILFVFGLAIALPLVLASKTASEYFQFVTSGTAAQPIQGIALLAIPTIAAAWLLRFLARLSMQNLSLAQDARQRHAQVTTYLNLLGDQKKPITESERILALAALFRPLPGQGGDDVNPPTIAEFFKDAQERLTRVK